ncbi:MAG: glycosyltransferase [Acetobacteraceae bacterium]
MSEPIDILVDVRALQDPDFAERGIGRLAVNLLAHARAAFPAGLDVRLIGIADSRLPPLSAGRRGLFDALRPNAYPGTLPHPITFIEPSPMTHDPLLVAPLLAHPAIPSVAIVHDFIPLQRPERYLRSPGPRLAYRIALAWLPRYRRYVADSEATANDLAELLGVSGERITVGGAPLDPVFEAAGDWPPRLLSHVLVAGGEDPRKNVASALRAHAASAALRRADIPIFVTGKYSPRAVAELSTLYGEAGGEPRHLGFAGHVPDRALARLYRDALAVVCPSRAEGFSLPIIEAMAAGAPVLASAIPAHAELIKDPALLFAPDDEVGLSRLLERILAEPGFAEAIRTDQAAIWPCFRAEQVARHFWTAIPLPAEQPTPYAVRGYRPRLALLSPLPPDRSGCADYTAAVCPALGRKVELELFTAAVRPLPISGALSIRPLSALPFASGAFDRVIGVMGNSVLIHLGIFDLLLRYGGACIAHDSRLAGFYCALGMERARAAASAEVGRQVEAAEIESWVRDESRLEALFLGELAASCEPLIFHSRIAAERCSRTYQIAARFLPFAVYRTVPDQALLAHSRAAARERLGIAREDVLLTTFGDVNQTKCPEECIWALDMLRGWGIHARLTFVGRTWNEPTALLELAATLGIDRRVCFLPNYASEAVYRDFLLAADVGIQLRAYGLGQVSGALTDCIAAGLATIANAELAEAIGAPSYVHRIPDAISPVLLANEIADVLESGAHTRRLTPERGAYLATHSARAYAESLCELLGFEPIRDAA